MWYWISTCILKTLGWKQVRPYNIHEIPKFIIIAAPHTSSWDFLLGLLIRSSNKLETKFLGKSSLFKPPLGYIFRSLGGYPVDRQKNNNLVQTVVDIFNKHDRFSIALSPEGTRKKVTSFKTGFYHIAKAANIPIIMIKFDFGNKIIDFHPPIYTSDDQEEDIRNIENHFKGIVGKRPNKGFF